MTDLEKSILATLVWFDIFDYPLTAQEIWQYQRFPNLELQSLTFREFQKFLKESEKLKNFVAQEGEFYFLKGRENLIKIRQERYLIAEKKFNIAFRAIKLSSLFPFVRMIAICNGLSYANSKKDDDIDLFIVIKEGRIWLTRFCITVFLSILGWRRFGHKIKDKICLSFFLTDKNLNLEKIAIDDDIYLQYWIFWLYPVFNENETYQKFLKENQWAISNFPNFFKTNSVLRKEINLNKFLRNFKMFLEKVLTNQFGSFLEKIFKKIQIRIMKRKDKKFVWQKGKSVIISDKILKFHLQDKREEYREKFKKRILEIKNIN